MGFRICWLATQHPEADVLAALGLRATGRTGHYPDFPLVAVALGNGWTVIWAADETFFTPRRCEDLSRRFPLIGVHVNETVMHSSVVACQNGAAVWSVWHEGDEVRGHIAASGIVPDSYPHLVAEARKAEAADSEVDFLFEVPLQLAHGLCGFKHDEFQGQPEQCRELALAQAPGAADGWLRRLFRR